MSRTAWAVLKTVSHEWKAWLRDFDPPLQRLGQRSDPGSSATRRMNNMTSTNKMNLGTSVALAALVIALFGWLRADIGEVRADIDDLRGEMRADIDKLRGEMDKLRGEVRADIGALRTELRAEIGALRSEVRADIAALRTEVQADMVSLRQ